MGLQEARPQAAAQLIGPGLSHTFKVKKPRKGDLVFFYGSSGVYHVGIYAGKRDGRRWVWHAPGSGEAVKKDPIWTDSHFIRRVKYGKKR